MARIISPPLNQLDSLTAPLTEGERQVLRFFDHTLPESWEIYVQPFLNGLRPDFVLLNPAAGIAVFEVKDWSIGAYEARGCAPDVNLFKRRTDQRIEDPISQLHRYKEEIINLYCPRLNTTTGRVGLQAVTAGVIMTRCSDDEAKRFLSPFLRPGMREHPQYYPISGRKALACRNIGAVFPESGRTTSLFMNEDMAEDLRHWLREPAFAREQRQPLRLDARQREIATNRVATRLRRAKGPAGTGKTVALAARAAHLAAEGKRVLVCSYNLTLINYIRDIAAQYGRSEGLNAKDIVYLGFHRWCKRVCHQAGYDREYDAIWGGASDERDEDVASNSADDALDHRLDELLYLTRTAFRQARRSVRSVTFDAILVDEGQDWRPEWWNTLRLALREGGEMLLIADMTQDVYGTARGWTDAAMTGCGFNGPWFQLEQSYRLPMKLIPLLREYGSKFLRDGEPDIPQSSQQELDLDDAALRWRQTTRDSLAGACVEEIIAQMRQPQSGSAIADITFLAGNNALGRMVVEQLEDRGIDVMHTYDQNSRQASRQKMAFCQGAGKIRATTLHSFKGWESAQLVVAVPGAKSRQDLAGLYTAMTRLQRTDAGSALTVVNAEPELRSFGQTWPEFSDDRGGRGKHRSGTGPRRSL